MNKEKVRESAVRISLLDVMYGVVFAYGFRFFDQASMPIDYVRFFLAYAVITVDWIYVHPLYWGWKNEKDEKNKNYSNWFLMIDMGVLFTISRMLRTSTTGYSPCYWSSCYWFWILGLFAIYAIWDFALRGKGVEPQYWCDSIIGDLFGAIVFLAFYILLLKGKLQPEDFLTGMTVFVYFIVALIWFKKFPPTLLKRLRQLCCKGYEC